MKLFRKYNFIFVRIFLTCACIFFLFSGFELKLKFVKASHIIELINKDFYTGLEEITVGNYKFLYDSEESKNDIDFIVDTLDKNKDLALDSLELENEPPITIRVLSKFNKSHDDALGYVYFHNNIINILNRSAHEKTTAYSTNEKINSIFSETLMHEYTHSIINTKLVENKIFPKKLPLWFNEGVAEYIGKTSVCETVPTTSNSIVKPSELNTLINNNNDMFYEQSSIFVNSIISEHGISSVSRIIENLKKDSFTEALEKTTLEDVDSLSEEAFNTTY